MIELPSNAWTDSADSVLSILDVSPDKGLGLAPVRERRRIFGSNRLQEIKRKSIWRILANQFKSIIVGFLVVASLLSYAFGEVTEGIAIAVVIMINVAIGFVTELKGIRSMEALQRLGNVVTRVRRDSIIQEVSAEDLVPGDIVLVEGGDVVTADLRLITASKLQADESTLTGESLPTSKNIEQLDGIVPLAERANMLYKGTAVTRGSGEGVVVATGMETELGRISLLVEQTEEEATPLEKRLRHLGRALIIIALAIIPVIVMVGVLAGRDLFLMLETAIALAVAAIPEGLPVVATIALARGVWRMARRNALVKQLSAVETLGATNVICTDKTGTLTENRMTVSQLLLGSERIDIDKGEFTKCGGSFSSEQGGLMRKALEVGVLCNNASIQSSGADGNAKATGDPLEVALLVAADKAGISREQFFEAMPEEREEAFDSETKMMATFHKKSDEYYVAVKGAPEVVLRACSHLLTDHDKVEMLENHRKQWLDHNEKMAQDGLRVLAMAAKTVGDIEAEPYENLQFIGLVGLLDPPREDVRESIDLCRQAGIKVIMVTGDQSITARIIGLFVGLTDDDNAAVVHGKDLKSAETLSEQEQRRLLDVPIFSRVSPKQKLDLIAVHRKHGAIVAMTGDGVNDAPALKQADVGIAMGQRGTQVAHEAADVILKDDAFSTIVVAIEQGRIIFDNIRKFVIYLISCNISEILVVALASIANAPLPILPLQILFLNIVTDIFPALALGTGEGNPQIMRRPPRDPSEPFLTRRHWYGITWYACLITLSVLGAFAIALAWLDINENQAMTVSFLTLAFAQLWHVFNMSDRTSGLFSNDITSNSLVWLAIVICTGLLVAAVFVPSLSSVLKVTSPGFIGWIVAISMSMLPLVVVQSVKAIGKCYD